VQAATQCFYFAANGVVAGAGVGADEDSNGLISAIFVALNAYSLFLNVARLTAVLTAFCDGLHNMSSQ
jgi:hypothetical protein